MSNNFKHRVGLQSKLKAMENYVSKGYYVFNETNQGPIDFIAINLEGDINFLECKTLARRKDGSKINRILTDNQKKLNKIFNSKGYPSIKIIYSEIDNPFMENDNAK